MLSVKASMHEHNVEYGYVPYMQDMHYISLSPLQHVLLEYIIAT